MDTEHLNESVATVASIRDRVERQVSRHQRWIERLTDQIGRPRSLYWILAVIALWGIGNVVAPRCGVPAVDPPPFQYLQGLVGFAALLMTTMILTTQNRQTRDLDRSAQLELQVNLFAEQKVAKLIALIEELRRDIPTVSDRVDHVAEVMQEPVDPHAVLSALEETMDNRPAESRSPKGG